MTIARHGACGKSWPQYGNRTGHCGGCHETFEGLSLFDAHQRSGPDGQPVCADPAGMEYPKGWVLRLDEHGVWRTTKPGPYSAVTS